MIKDDGHYKRFARIILILAISFFISLCAAGGGYTAEEDNLGKSDFALVVNFGETASEPGKLWVVGKFEPARKITLLLEGKNTCVMETSPLTEEAESSGAILTELLGKCQTANKFFLEVALIGRPVRDYERIAPKETADVEEIASIDGLIRSSNVLTSLLKKAQDRIPGELEELKGVIPKVNEVMISGSKIRIASYQKPDFDGPKVIMIEGRVYPLAGWCSSLNVNVFRLNGQHYAYASSYCCGCGIHIEQIFRITPEGPVEVLSEYSLSD